MSSAAVHRPDPARIGRRSVLILALASLTAASAPPDADVPPIMQPIPVAPSVPRSSVRLLPVSHWAEVYQQSREYERIWFK